MISELYEIPLASFQFEPLYSLFPEHYLLISCSQTSLTKFSLSDALSILQSKQKFESSYVVQIEPQFLINKPYQLVFIGFSFDGRFNELFHVYSCDTQPDFVPNEHTRAKAMYKFTIPEPLTCKLEITWDYPLTLLSDPGKFCKSCTVFARGGIGTHNLLESYHRDLEIISKLKTNNKFFMFNTSCKEKLQKFLENEEKILKGKFDENSSVGEVGRIREEKMATLCGMIPRCDFDFTDKLWEVLKYSANYNEMRDAYMEILKIIKEKRIVPKISEKNCSRLGVNLLRIKKIGWDEECYRTERNFWQLFDTFADNIVEVCVEIAVNKLKNDFLDFLVTGNVCFSHQIEFLTADNCENIEESIEKLEKLFKVLQIAVLIKTAGLKVNTVHGIIVPLLEYYKKNSGFPLVTHKIEETLEVPNLSQFVLENWEAVQEETQQDCKKTQKFFFIDQSWYIVVSEKYECS